MNMRLLIQAADPDPDIQAVAEMGQFNGDGLTAIAGVAYSGGPLMQPWSSAPVYVDLAGLAIRAQVPLLYNHYNSPMSRIGQIQAVVQDGKLTISGGIDPAAEGADRLIAMGRKIPWQLSIGAFPEKIVRLEAGEKTNVNGRDVTGPALIARKSTLNEVSLVAVGADADTHLQICASLNISSSSFPIPSSTTNQKEGQPMLTEKLRSYITAKYQLGSIGDAEIIAHLTSIGSSIAAEETAQAAASTPPVKASAPTQPAAGQAAVAGQAAIEAAAVQAERQRIAEIDRACIRHPEIAAKARAEGWDANRTRTAVLDAINASYAPSAPNIGTPPAAVATQQTLLAAAFQAVGVEPTKIEAACGRQALDAADRRWRGNIGLQEMIIEAALANGFSGAPRRMTGGNWHDVTKAAITASGYSSVSLPGLLGGVISRSLEQGFGVVDDSWRQIASERNVQDFREVESYRMHSDGGMEKVGPTGELKHGSLSEQKFTNRAETYGKMLTITRQDIINDDLGALVSVPQQLGLDAAMSFNAVFWGEFMDNAAFFADGNGNLLANNPLGVEGLSAALKMFRTLKDGAGRMLGMTPALLLVPPSLETMAGSLFKDSQIIAVGVGSSAKTVPSGNPHAGKYTPVVSPYLEETSLTGYSSTAYYLLSRPAFMSAIQVAFLNGVKTPTVQSSEMVFSTLGIQFRAYFDFGVKKKDPSAGIKVAGNA